MLPEINPTTPSAPPAFTATPQINGTILFDWTTPIIKPSGTEFQIIRSTNSADASVGTVVWQGLAAPVPLVMPTSRHWYYVRAIANSAFSAYQPNTFGVLGEGVGESDRTFNRSLTPDPEVQLSNINGRFWGFERGDVFSLSLTGGQVDGHIRTMAGSWSPQNALLCVAMPTSPYQRNALGREVRMVARLRPVTAIASKAIYEHYLETYGWTGVGSPCMTNGNLSVPVSRLIIRVTSNNGTVLATNVYKDFTNVDTIGAISAIDPTSYPYLATALRLWPAGGPASGFANSGDTFEFDLLYASML